MPVHEAGQSFPFAALTGKPAQVERVEGQDAEEASRRHSDLHFGGVGVDAPQETDQYYRLLVDSCFYVGGMGSKCQAEVITSAEYMVSGALGTPVLQIFLTPHIRPSGSGCTAVILHVKVGDSKDNIQQEGTAFFWNGGLTAPIGQRSAPLRSCSSKQGLALT